MTLNCWPRKLNTILVLAHEKDFACEKVRRRCLSIRRRAIKHEFGACSGRKYPFASVHSIHCDRRMNAHRLSFDIRSGTQPKAVCQCREESISLRHSAFSHSRDVFFAMIRERIHIVSAVHSCTAHTTFCCGRVERLRPAAFMHVCPLLTSAGYVAVSALTQQRAS